MGVGTVLMYILYMVSWYIWSTLNRTLELKFLYFPQLLLAFLGGGEEAGDADNCRFSLAQVGCSMITENSDLGPRTPGFWPGKAITANESIKVQLIYFEKNRKVAHHCPMCFSGFFHDCSPKDFENYNYGDLWIWSTIRGASMSAKVEESCIKWLWTSLELLIGIFLDM